MKKILVFLAAAAALVACNKNEVTTAPGQGGREIRFTSDFSTYTVTKAASVLDGKTVKIFAGAPINASTEAEANDSQLTPATKLYWVKDQTDPTTFASIYPADVATTTSFEYDVANGDYAYHSAVLTATATVTPENVVNFAYKHPFAMLKVAVTNNLQGSPTLAGVEIRDIRWCGTMDIAAGTVTDLKYDAVVGATLDNGKYCLVMLPQTARPAILVTVGEATAAKTYKFVITSDVTFEANKFYNVALTLDDSTPPVVTGGEVEFGFTVSDWEEASTAMPVLNVTETWSVIGTLNDTEWGTDYDMTYDATTGICTLTGVNYRANDEFKLRKAHGWDESAGVKEGVTIVGEGTWDGYLEANSTRNIKLAAAGVYTLTFKPEDYTFTATKTGDVAAEPDPVWTIIGSATNWETDYVTLTCTTPGTDPSKGEGVWEGDLTYAEGDLFKLRLGGTWDVNAGLKYGVTYVNDNNWDGYLDAGGENIKLEAAGNYHVVFTYPSHTFVVTKIVNP